MVGGKMPSVPGSSNAVLRKGYGRGDESLMLSTISGLAGRFEVVVLEIVRVSVSGAFDDSRVESMVTESVRVPVSGVFGSPMQLGSPMSGLIHGGSAELDLSLRVSEPFLFGSIVMLSPIRVFKDVAPGKVSSMPQVSSVLCDLQYGATSQSISEFGRVVDQVLSLMVRSCNHGFDVVRVSIGPAVYIGLNGVTVGAAVDSGSVVAAPHEPNGAGLSSGTGGDV
ncbi:hypothetical protein NE237_015742 [Protea cynaroides]|uniref:Uncharacterized protein n=1 Tax=Protea cynaroides TaxID=273540 RepID=A0A9Q0KEJ6_9MAGN|nr:hypothetical protein NE237_015742 [Protea cynaroides]